MKPLTKVLFTFALLIALLCFGWIIYLKLVNIDTVFTTRLKLQTFWKPSALCLSAIPFYLLGKYYQFKK